MTTQTTALLLSFAAATAAACAQGAAKTPRPQDPLAAAWFNANALARQHKAPMLAFVLPAAAARADDDRATATRAAEKKVGMLLTKGGARALGMRTARDVLLRQVQLLRGSQPSGRTFPPKASDAQMVFALTVPVFATPESCGARRGETVVLLGPRGERIRGWQLDLLDRDAFVQQVGGEVFAERALAPRQANVPHGVRQKLRAWRKARQVDPQDQQAAVEARQLIQKLTGELSGQLVAAGPALVRREGARLVAEGELWVLETERAPLGSAAHMDLGDPCPGCGMGFVPKGLMTVLKLIGP